MFEKYDLDKDDKISLEEFKLFLKEKNHELRSDIPCEVLGRFLQFKEFLLTISKTGIFNSLACFQLSKLDEIVERIDWDKNRFITYNEFIRMVRS